MFSYVTVILYLKKKKFLMHSTCCLNCLYPDYKSYEDLRYLIINNFFFVF